MRAQALPRSVKLVLDRAGAACLLVLLSPLLLLVSLAVRVWMGSPVLFRQARLGWKRRPFELLKFRTMLDATGLPDEARLTALGRFLRRTSLDELPQLLHIVRGEMSFVGPRPLLARYAPYFSPAEQRRHDVRPGMTGWAQIHGRNRLGWNERLARDIWYVGHWSPWLDARILWRTCGLVVTGRSTAPTPGKAIKDLDVERAESAGGAR